MENNDYKKWCNYRSTTQKPNMFDEFWEKGKKEIDHLSLAFELNEHELFSTVASGYDLYFTGVHGAKIHVQVVMPKKKSQTKSPILFLFHGYHGNAGDWSDKIGFAAEGYTVVALDVRGQGGLSEDTLQTTGGTLKGHIMRGIEQGPESLFFRNVFLDIYQLTKIAKRLPNVEPDNMSAYGASQGGALAIVCAFMEPKIQQIFVLYPFLSDYRNAYRLNVTVSAYEEIAYWFKFHDPEHQQEAHVFNTLDYIDIQFFAPKIQADVLWGMGMVDQICHPQTQFAVYNQLVGKKELIVYPEYGHEYIPKFSDRMRKKMNQNRQ